MEPGRPAARATADTGKSGPVPVVGIPPTGGPAGARPSWHARSGRLTARKRWALDELATRYAPSADDPADGRLQVALEIGAGTGEAALALAAARPELLVLAAEVHKASLARLLLDLEATGSADVRVFIGDGRDLLAALADRAGPPVLELLRVFFPDPWPKRRHHGRRLVDGSFVALAARALRPGGLLELATDDAAYAAAMAEAVGADRRFAPAPGPCRADRPHTYYELRAIDAGRTVHDLRVRRLPDGTSVAIAPPPPDNPVGPAREQEQ